MIKNIYSKFQKLSLFDKFLSLFIFTTWFLLLLSVGSNSSEFLLTLKKIFLLELNISEIITFSYFRSGIVIFIFFSLLCLLFYLWIRKEKYNQKIHAEDILIFLFFVYILIAFIGLNFSCGYVDNLLNIIEFTCKSGVRKNYFFSIHFLISSLCLIFIYFLCTIKKNVLFIKYAHFYALILFIFILSLFIIFLNELAYGGIHLKIKALDFTHYINSNGSGRILLILNIYLYSLYYSNFFKNKINKLLIELVLIITSTIIYALEGKFNILMLTFLFLIYNFYISKENLKIKLKNLLILLILPFMICQINIISELNYRIKIKCKNDHECLKYNIFTKDENSNRIVEILNVIKEEIFITTEELQITIPSKPYLSSRKEKWIFLFNDFLERKYYLGNGPEYDRQLLINLAEKKGAEKVAVNSDAANAFIYSILTSGIFGAILYLYACIYSLWLVGRYILSNKNKSIIVNFSTFSYLTIMSRSLIESGFMSWNFDQFILISSLIILKLNSNQLSK